MKRILAITLSLLFFFPAVGCIAENTQPVSLYDRGLALAALLDEMVKNDALFALYSGASDLKEIVSGIEQDDYSHPQNVYEITIKDDLLTAFAEISSMPKLSNELKAYLLARAQSAVVTQLNAACGAKALAVSSIYTVSQTFVCEEAPHSTIYLYTYENALPIVVTFLVGDGGAISATANFLFNSAHDTDSLEETAQAWSELADVRVVVP